jgi:hypothetical protein
VKEIKVNLQKRVNLLKYSAGIKWGGHPKMLSILFKNFIRSKMDYGPTIYANRNDSKHRHETDREICKNDTYSCYGSNHGNGKPRTQKGLNGGERGLKEHLQN